MSHRVPFPGKPRGRLKQGRQIVRTAGQPGKPDKLESIEKTRLFLEDFYETYGNSDEDEDLEGFTVRELERARNKIIKIDANINLIRDDISSAIECQFEEKYKSILPQKVTTYTEPKPSLHSDHLYNKHKIQAKTDKKSSNINCTKSPKTSVLSFTKPKGVTSHQRRSLDVTRRHSVGEGLKSRRRSIQSLTGVVSPAPKKLRVQIQIPSWRPVTTAKCPGWKSLPGPIEDLSDEAYLARHAKAEEEEQLLWDKWQTLRKHSGQRGTGGGRSKSRRWREMVLNNPTQQPLNDSSNPVPTLKAAADILEQLEPPKAATAARRCQRRVSSLQSEDSFCSGRLSPRTSSLQEIMVVTAPPTPIPEESTSTYASELKPYLRSNGMTSPCYSTNISLGSRHENSFSFLHHTSSSPPHTSPNYSETKRESHSDFIQHEQPQTSRDGKEIMPLSPPLSPISSSTTMEHEQLSPKRLRNANNSKPFSHHRRKSSNGSRLDTRDHSPPAIENKTSDRLAIDVTNSTPLIRTKPSSNTRLSALMSPKSLQSVISSSELLLKTSPHKPSSKTPSKNPAKTLNNKRTPSKSQTAPNVKRAPNGICGSPVTTTGKDKNMPNSTSRSLSLSPCKRPTTPKRPLHQRESYPLRSQSPSRRTRLGAARR